MAKIAPDIQASEGLDIRSQRTRDFVSERIRRIHGDVNDRAGWIDTKIHFFRRRYGLEWRHPIYPWENSSDVVMPMIDMHIDRMKPLFTNLVFRTKPPVTFLSDRREDVDKVNNNEIFFDWLIRRGSPGFKREIVLGVDNMLSSGMGIWKSGWKYEVHMAPDRLTRAKLPAALQKMIVSKSAGKVDDAVLEFAQAQTGANILTPSRFDELRPQVEQLLSLHYQLDPEDSTDQRAMREIITWLKAGAPGSLKIKRRDVFVDSPVIHAVHPNDFVVPNHTTDLEDAERLVHIMFYSERQLHEMVRTAGWNERAVKELISAREKRSRSVRATNPHRDRLRQEEMFREGIGSTTDRDPLFEIWEISTWWSRPNSNKYEKAVFLASPEVSDLILDGRSYNRPSGKWNYHATFFEINNRRFYSARGVGEKIDDLDAEATHQHRAKLNRATIANSPTFLVRSGANIEASNWRWLPGQFYPVQNPQADVVPLNIPNLDISFERSEDHLRQWAEQLLGSADMAINTNTATQEARTAEEIRAIQSVARNALSLRGEMFQDCMSEIYNEFFDMWHEWGPEEIWVNVTGSEPQRYTKEQLQGDFQLIPTGKIGEQDEAMEAQRKLARMQVLLQIQEMGGLGDEYELSLPTAILDWLESEDLRAARRIVRKRDPQEVQQIQAQRQQQAEQQQALASNQAQSPEELEMQLKEIEKKSPHGGRQKVQL